MLALESRLILDLRLAHAPTRAETEVRLFLAKKRGESMAHVTMKLLAWCIHWAPDAAELFIEAPAGQHYKPDVVRFAASARGGAPPKPELWIDCGRTAPKKLAEVVQKNRGTRVVIVKRTATELAHYRQSALPRLRRIARPDLPLAVAWLGFDDGFVDRLGLALWGRHALEVALSAASDRLAVTVDGGATDETSLTWLPTDDEPHNVALPSKPRRGTHG